ncbi:MAG: extracellular solute-binding protein, partial [Pseudomonadota bacterium]|nr:extracellular solute-binding protein [Pseudomonadota bacterium]
SLVGNLARKPQGNDRAQAKAIFAGECDVALMNTYYFGKMKFNEKEPDQKQWADAIDLLFFNQDGRGQHVNISAGALLKSSKNKDEARKFLEWLTTAEAQRLYTEVNYEYPVNPATKPSDEVASWGSFRIDELSLNEIARLSPAAQKIINETGW